MAEAEHASHEVSLRVLAAVLVTMRTAADTIAIPLLAQAVDLALTLVQTVEVRDTFRYIGPPKR